jgi:hypothetical protein
MDTTGLIYGVLVKNGVDLNVTLAVCAIAGFAIRALGNWLLKRATTNWGRFGVSVLWRVLAILFGKSIVLTNAQVDPREDAIGKSMASDELNAAVKADLKKRYPFLDIKIGDGNVK